MKIVVIAALLSIAGATVARADSTEDLDCSAPADTQTATLCAAEDLDKADAELNAVYKEARAAQAEIDKSRKEAGLSDAEAVKSLKAAERAWVTFRDANCESMTAQNIGGTGYSQFVVACQIEMTRARTKELKTLTGEAN